MLIAMAVHDTQGNKRTDMTRQTLESLSKTVDWSKHRLFICDNGSCIATQALYAMMPALFHTGSFKVLHNDVNIGTANAINRAWRYRAPHEHCIKMDNDVVIHQAGWVDWIEDVFERDPKIGICGLKRKDLDESPWADDLSFKSKVYMLPHEKGQRWLVVEEVDNVMGTCQAFSSALLGKIGYLTQPGVYGFDDSLASVRARVARFKRVFLHGFELDHIDPGGDGYCKWKISQANIDFKKYGNMAMLYTSGAKDVYYDGGFADEGI